jgi:hypothetical protein
MDTTEAMLHGFDGAGLTSPLNFGDTASAYREDTHDQARKKIIAEVNPNGKRIGQAAAGRGGVGTVRGEASGRHSHRGADRRVPQGVQVRESQKAEPDGIRAGRVRHLSDLMLLIYRQTEAEEKRLPAS